MLSFCSFYKLLLLELLRLELELLDSSSSVEELLLLDVTESAVEEELELSKSSDELLELDEVTELAVELLLLDIVESDELLSSASVLELLELELLDSLDPHFGNRTPFQSPRMRCTTHMPRVLSGLRKSSASKPSALNIPR